MTEPSDSAIPTRHGDTITDEARPFADDLLERSNVAEKLTRFVNRFPGGCVIGIDAPWGEGKTWFGRRWAVHLRNASHRVAWLDAFESDWSDDPFLALTAEIRTQSEASQAKKKKLLESAKQVAKAALPIAGKTAASIIARAALGARGSEIVQDAFDEADRDIGKAVEKYVERRMADHDLHKKSVEQFRKALEGIAAQNGRSMIFFVDELDRCRPDYAVRLVERIKHFFDVPGLIFVLLLNRSQLQQAIRGMYGQDVDAHAYLGKFVHFFVRLPKPSAIEDPRSNFNHRYCAALIPKFGFPNSDEVRSFAGALADFGSHMNLSLRDLEKGFTLFSLAQPIHASAPFLAWMIVLKLSRPDVFAGIAAGSPQSHEEAEVALKGLAVPDGVRLLACIRALHLVNSNRDLAPVGGQEALAPLKFMGQWGVRPEGFLASLAAKIDLAIF